MQDDTDSKSNFLNRRDWSSYLSALQETAAALQQTAASYPKIMEAKVMEAVRSGRDWVAEGASQATNWLTSGVAGAPQLQDKLTTG